MEAEINGLFSLFYDNDGELCTDSYKGWDLRSLKVAKVTKEIIMVMIFITTVMNLMLVDITILILDIFTIVVWELSFPLLAIAVIIIGGYISASSTW